MRKPTLLQTLQKWWEKKYSLPSTHELFQHAIYEELVVEFYEDIFEQSPLEMYRSEDGEVMFSDTGDDLIDKWEKQIAEGNYPDMSEAFDPDSFKFIQKVSRDFSRSTLTTGGAPTIGDAHARAVRKQEALIEKQDPALEGLLHPKFGDS